MPELESWQALLGVHWDQDGLSSGVQGVGCSGLDCSTLHWVDLQLALQQQ